MRGRRRGFTLIEVVIALTIMAMVSVAFFVLLSGALRTDSYLRQTTTAISEVDLASRRIIHNVRMASQITAPTTTAASGTLTLVTQPDVNNGNATYTVTYSLSGGQLSETDSRYGTNVIANNVTAFSVQLVSTTTPVSAVVTLTEGAPGNASRVFTVWARNL